MHGLVHALQNCKNYLPIKNKNALYETHRQKKRGPLNHHMAKYFYFFNEEDKGRQTERETRKCLKGQSYFGITPTDIKVPLSCRVRYPIYPHITRSSRRFTSIFRLSRYGINTYGTGYGARSQNRNRTSTTQFGARFGKIVNELKHVTRTLRYLITNTRYATVFEFRRSRYSICNFIEQSNHGSQDPDLWHNTTNP
jgi:hypothetical protein